MGGKLVEWLTGLLGGAIWLTITAFMILSLPFSIIALMRWFDFGFWGALLIAIGVNMIPFVGWITYATLAIAGCYFFLTSGFSFEEAARSNRSVQTPMSMKAVFYKICMERSDEWLRSSERPSQGIAEFCKCSSEAVYAKLTVQEIEHWQKHRTQTEEFQAVAAKAIRDCAAR